jgi:hypothetical protein
MQDDTIKALYPQLTEEERKICSENLDRYLELAWELYEQLRSPDS